MKKFLVRLLVSLVVGAAMFYLATRVVDFSRTWEAMTQAQWWVMWPYLAAMAVQHFFRAWRWSFLLAPIHPVPFKRILPVASVGFFAIVSLPFRMGELVRPYFIADPPRIRMSQGLGTMAVERVFDGLILALMCFVAVAEARTRTHVPSWILLAGIIAFCFFFGVLVALILALWKKDRAVELCRNLFGRISPRLGDRLAHVAEGIVEGFKALPEVKSLLLFIFGTLAYWFLNGTAVWILSYGFGLDLSLWAGICVMVIVGIGIMIPGGPAFIGTFEMFAGGALLLYVSQAEVQRAGSAYILTFHFTNFLWYAFFGFLAMFSPEVSFRKFWKASTGPMDEDPDQDQDQDQDQDPDPDQDQDQDGGGQKIDSPADSSES